MHIVYLKNGIIFECRGFKFYNANYGSLLHYEAINLATGETILTMWRDYKSKRALYFHSGSESSFYYHYQKFLIAMGLA